MGSKEATFKKSSFKKIFFNSQKIGQISLDCKFPRRNKNHEAIMIDDIPLDVYNLD